MLSFRLYRNFSQASKLHNKIALSKDIQDQIKLGLHEDASIWHKCHVLREVGKLISKR